MRAYTWTSFRVIVALWINLYLPMLLSKNVFSRPPAFVLPSHLVIYRVVIWEDSIA